MPGNIITDPPEIYGQLSGVQDVSLLAIAKSNSYNEVTTALRLLNQHIFGTPPSVYTFGAKGDGTTDDTAAIQAAIDASIGDNAPLSIPQGDYLVSSPLVINAPITVQGVGDATFLIPDGATTPVIRVLAADDVNLINLKCRAQNDRTTHTLRANFIEILGACENILVADCSTKNMGRHSFYVDGSDPLAVTVGNVQRCKFFRCIGGDSYRVYTYFLDSTRDVLVLACQGLNAWLDGIKLGANSLYTTIIDCEFSDNGVSFPGSNGNGIDTFTGGDTVLFLNNVTNRNGGSGINIKAGNLTGAVNGYIRNIQIANCIAEENQGSGLDITASVSTILPTRISINGGYYSRNLDSGVRVVNGHNITINGAIAYKNNEIGFNIGSETSHVTLNACYAVANGATNPGTRIQFNFGGAHIRAIGCHAIGSDKIDIVDRAGYNGTDIISGYGFFSQSNARDVECRGCFARDHAVANYDINAANTNFDALVVKNQKGTGAPNVKGSRGSVYIQEDNARVWVKHSADGTQPAKGWVPAGVENFQRQVALADITGASLTTPIGYWPLAISDIEETDSYDFVGAGGAGYRHTQGVPGDSIEVLGRMLNGTNYADASETIFQLTAEMSLSLWFYVEGWPDNTDVQYLAAYADSSTAAINNTTAPPWFVRLEAYQNGSDSQRPCVGHFLDNGSTITADWVTVGGNGISVRPYRWHHLAFTREYANSPTNTLFNYRLFIDGELVGTALNRPLTGLTGSPSANMTCMLGTGPNRDNPFVGIIRGLGLWNVQLPNADIAKIYDLGRGAL